MKTHRYKVGFLASRNGSSMRAIIEAAGSRALDVDPRIVVSNNRSAPALDYGRQAGLATLVLPTKSDPDEADRRLCEAMSAAGVDLIVLSGYLRHLGPRTLDAYRNRILNVHPGLLPEFGGEGMYGRRVHEAVIASGARTSGATIHAVDEIYDHGPVVARRTTPVSAEDTVDSLEARVSALEPGFFVETLRAISEGRLRLPG